jgi:hypothetical protein
VLFEAVPIFRSGCGFGKDGALSKFAQRCEILRRFPDCGRQYARTTGVPVVLNDAH